MERDAEALGLDVVHKHVSTRSLFDHLQNEHGHEDLPDFPTLGTWDRGYLEDLHLDDHWDEEYPDNDNDILAEARSEGH